MYSKRKKSCPPGKDYESCISALKSFWLLQNRCCKTETWMYHFNMAIKLIKPVVISYNTILEATISFLKLPISGHNPFRSDRTLPVHCTCYIIIECISCAVAGRNSFRTGWFSKSSVLNLKMLFYHWLNDHAMSAVLFWSHFRYQKAG